MLKRVRWMGLGAVLGVSASAWAQVKLRRTAQRYQPPEIAARVAGRARDLGGDVRTAVEEGRQAMHEREAELRARLTGPRTHGDVHDVASRSVAPALRPGQVGPPARLARAAGSEPGGGRPGDDRRR